MATRLNTLRRRAITWCNVLNPTHTDSLITGFDLPTTLNFKALSYWEIMVVDADRGT